MTTKAEAFAIVHEEIVERLQAAVRALRGIPEGDERRTAFSVAAREFEDLNTACNVISVLRREANARELQEMDDARARRRAELGDRR